MITRDLTYAEVRDAIRALGWAPIHTRAIGRGLWRVSAGGREAVASSPGMALVSLLVVHAVSNA